MTLTPLRAAARRRAGRAAVLLAPLAVWLVAAAACGAQEAGAYGVVRRVIDGDTIVVDGIGRVRLIGVDAPELRDHRETVRELARRSADYARERLTGRTVRLAFDWQRHDRYGRTLAYVYLPDGTFFNAKIIREGYAFALTRFPFKYLEEFRRYEREAREARRGLWAEGASARTGLDHGSSRRSQAASVRRAMPLMPARCSMG